MDLEECLGMGANRANFRCLGASDQVTAVAALPHHDAGLLEDSLGFHIMQQSTIALFMALFDGRYTAELGSQLLEAFFFGFAGHAVIHVGPLVVFAVGSFHQVFGSIAYFTQRLIPQFGMLFFVGSGFQEQRSNLLKALLLSYGREESILVARLGLTRKGFLQVLFGLGTGVRILLHISYPPLIFI